MKKNRLIATTLIIIVACGLKEKGTPKYSELGEWGLTGEVKILKAFYFKNVKKNGKDMNPIDKEQWDRMTITYYNRDGNMDSLKIFNSKNASPMSFVYSKKDEINNTDLLSDNDTVLFSKKYWKSKYHYVIEILSNNKVETKEMYYLDEKYRMKEIKREHYSIEDNSIEYTSGENIYFNDANRLDSIRAFSDGKLDNLTLNVDLEQDRNNNPIKTSKKVGQLEPYLIIREYTYY